MRAHRPKPITAVPFSDFDHVMLDLGSRPEDAHRSALAFRLARKLRPGAKIEIFVGGYDDDLRPLWMIPEAAGLVKAWARLVGLDLRFAERVPWGDPRSALALLTNCGAFGEVTPELNAAVQRIIEATDRGKLYGYLKPWVPQIIAGHQAGLVPAEIRERYLPRRVDTGGYWGPAYPSTEMVAYVLRRLGYLPPRPAFPPGRKPPTVPAHWLKPAPTNKGRPIDMGGPRDVWIDCDLWTETLRHER